MANYNKVLLMGNLTRDIELKHVPSGMAVANIGIAVNDRWKDKDSGEWQERANFVDCEAWGRTAEVMHQYLAKGRPVFIEGRLKLDTWQDKDGSNRSKLRVVVENFQFIDSRGGGESGGGGGGQPAYSGSQSSPGQQHQPIAEDDIPF
jgi:single-strand DNA-binding protein